MAPGGHQLRGQVLAHGLDADAGGLLVFGLGDRLVDLALQEDVALFALGSQVGLRRRVGVDPGVLVQHLFQRGAWRHGQDVGQRNLDHAAGAGGLLDLVLHILRQLLQDVRWQLLEDVAVHEDGLVGAIGLIDHALDVRAKLLGAALAQGRLPGQLHLLVQGVDVELQALVGELLDGFVHADDGRRLHAGANQRGDEGLVGSVRPLHHELAEGLLGVQVHPFGEVLCQGRQLLGRHLHRKLLADRLD